MTRQVTLIALIVCAALSISAASRGKHTRIPKATNHYNKHLNQALACKRILRALSSNGKASEGMQRLEVIERLETSPGDAAKEINLAKRFDAIKETPIEDTTILQLTSHGQDLLRLSEDYDQLHR